MLMWIFFWWLLGVVVIYAVNWRNWSIRDLERVELGDALGVLLGGLAWPFVLVVIIIQDDWLSVPVFDVDWFRRDRDE